MRIWCRRCDELMRREVYDDRHDVYVCDVCGIEVEAEK